MLSYEESIKKISDKEVRLPGYDLNGKAKLYSFRFSGGDKSTYKLSFNAEPGNTIVLSNGFTPVIPSNSAWYLDASAGESTKEVLIIGGDCDYTCTAKDQNGAELIPGSFQYEVTVSEITPKAYIMSEAKKRFGPEKADMLSEIDILNACLYQINLEYTNNGYVSLDGILNYLNSSKRVFSILYTVDFPPGAKLNVSVSCPMDGTMDRRKTLPPQYSYTYFLSPAKHWASFGSLDIKIITPKDAPYVTESSLPLKADGNNTYVSHLESLPNSELNFTLYKYEKITSFHVIRKQYTNFLSLLMPFLPFVFIIIIIVCALHKYNHEEEK